MRIALVRADSGFCTPGMIAELERRSLHYIMTAALRAPVRALCRHDDAAWTLTGVPGIEVQEVAREEGRLIILRQRVTERPATWPAAPITSVSGCSVDSANPSAPS